MEKILLGFCLEGCVFLEGNISKFRCINLNLTLSLPPRIGQPKIEYPLFSLQGWPKLTTKRPRCAKMEREFVPSNGPKIICILKVGWDLGQTCPNKKIPGDLGWGWVIGASFRRYVMAAVGHPFFMIRWWKIWTHRYFNRGSFFFFLSLLLKQKPWPPLAKTYII